MCHNEIKLIIIYISFGYKHFLSLHKTTAANITVINSSTYYKIVTYLVDSLKKIDRIWKLRFSAASMEWVGSAGNGVIMIGVEGKVAPAGNTIVTGGHDLICFGLLKLALLNRTKNKYQKSNYSTNSLIVRFFKMPFSLV